MWKKEPDEKSIRVRITQAFLSDALCTLQSNVTNTINIKHDYSFYSKAWQ